MLNLQNASKTIFLILSLSSMASAATPIVGRSAAQTSYAPFKWLDTSLANRSDLKGFDTDLVISSDFPPSTLFTTIKFPQVTATFFPDILSQILPLSQNQQVDTVGIKRDKFCPSHLAFASQASAVTATLPATCSTISKSITQISSDLDGGCLTTNYPELTFKNYQQGDIKASEMSDIDGLINMAGEAFYHLTPPAVWTTDAYMNPIRRVLQRIKFASIGKSLSTHQQAYAQALLALSKAPSCDPKHTLSNLVSGLQTESKDAQATLVRVDRDGRNEALADRQTVIKHGLQREVLPYPNLSDADRRLVSTLLGGVYWRLRGGGLRYQPNGTNAARELFNKLPMGAIGYLNGLDVGKSAGERQYIELILHGWGKFMTMGTTPGGFDLWYSFVKMVERGSQQSDPASRILDDAGYDPYEYQAGGRQMGLCYFFAYQTKLKDFLVNPKMQHPYREFIDAPTAWGELCTGATLTLGLADSLLKGHK
jgi:hypothetical protein